MSSIANIPLNEVITKHITTHHPTTGAATDADATPTYKIFEEDGDTSILSGDFVKIGTDDGLYGVTFSVTASNGFDVGGVYNLIATATVNSVTARHALLTFRVMAAETVVGRPVVSGMSSITTEGNVIVSEDS